MSDPALSGQAALVTGAGSGIGAAIATCFVAAGAHVIVTDIDKSAATGVADGLGAAATSLAHDVADEQSWKDAVSACHDQHGGLDILVNSAGIAGSGAPQDLEHIELSEWRSILTVNLDGVLLGTRAAIPALKTRGGGSIINISSVTGRLATPRAVAYGAAKAGVNHLTRSTALHCARRGYGIRCNAVEPGTIDTPMTRRVLSTEGTSTAGMDAARKRIPLDRLGDADDVAQAAVYLASGAGRYLTGVILPVDGGWSIPH